MPRRWSATAITCAILVACSPAGSGGDPATAGPRPTAPTATARAGPAARPPAADSDPAFDLEVPVGQLPRDVTVHGGRVWVANARSGSVWAVDPGSGAVVARVPTGPRPISFASLGGDLWVSVLGPGDAIVGRGIARIDAEAAAVAQEIEVPVQHALAVGGGSLWVMDGKRHVQRVDPSTGEVTAVVDVGGRPVAADADDRWVWLVREDGTAVRVDVAVDVVTAEVDTGAPAPGRSFVRIVGDEVWIAVTDRVHVLGAADGAVAGTIGLEGLQGTTGMAADDGSVWLASTVTEPGSALTAGLVLRLDRSTREVSDRFEIAGEPAGLAVDGSTVWVADQERNVLLRLEEGT